MGNKHEFSASLRINTIIDDAQRELQTLSKALDNTWQSGEPPKTVLKTFEQLKNRLASMQEIAKKGVVNSAEIKQAEEDYKSFQKNLHSLTVEFKLFSTEQKKAMLSDAEQKAMKARAEAVNKYTEALKKNQAIQGKRTQLQEKKSVKQDTVKTLKETQTKKQEELSVLQGTEGASTEQIKALKEELRQIGKDITDANNAIRELDISLDSLAELDANKIGRAHV